MDVDLEFRHLCTVETGDSAEPMTIDCMSPQSLFCQNSDELEKVFAGPQLSKSGISRSRMDSEREQTCDGLFGLGDCEKRASSPGRIKLTKRVVDGEILVEGWSDDGRCVYSRVDSAGEKISESEPLVKSAIGSPPIVVGS